MKKMLFEIYEEVIARPRRGRGNPMGLLRFTRNDITRGLLKRLLFTISLVAIIGIMPQAGICEDVSIGGYDVAKIAASTLNVLKENKIISEPVEKEFAGLLSNWPSDPLVLGTSFADFYSRLGTVLVEKNIASQKEIDAANAASVQSGGIKIGGVNPVVLAASYLDLLVRKGIITLPTAQSILDSSKTE